MNNYPYPNTPPQGPYQNNESHRMTAQANYNTGPMAPMNNPQYPAQTPQMMPQNAYYNMNQNMPQGYIQQTPCTPGILLQQRSLELKKNSNFLGLTGLLLWFFGTAGITAPKGIIAAQKAEAGGVPSELPKTLNWIMLILFYPWFWMLATAFSASMWGSGKTDNPLFGIIGFITTVGVMKIHKNYFNKHRNEIAEIRNFRDSLYYNSNPAFYNNQLPQHQPQQLNPSPQMPVIVDWQQEQPVNNIYPTAPYYTQHHQDNYPENLQQYQPQPLNYSNQENYQQPSPPMTPSPNMYPYQHVQQQPIGSPLEQSTSQENEINITKNQ